LRSSVESRILGVGQFPSDACPEWARPNTVREEIPMVLRPFVVLTLVLSFSPAAGGDDAKDADTIQGTWVPSAAELGGKMFPDEVRKSIKLVVKDDKYTVTVGKQVDQGTVKLNPAAKPKELDITGTDGPNKGKTILAIYERDGDTLRVCYDLGGKARPTEFKTREGTQLFLVTYKREKS
jgi:uncharacterized protein (TIGR03067 family)